ncbi:DinB family protein [Cohnella ginsengisoli]|uniref:DinB family protein n=1 Tax=Cohnella ginsengisoli TaxID=425004 RepID=A0A9X4KMI9_9BACL|nr:DinB family protein [Cohnella ginsengisoli]MDG0792315.1 DinB family protein [Cohnella ginsengisoli]
MISLGADTIVLFKQFTDWTDTLRKIDERIWIGPIAEGKATVAEIIAHLQHWDRYLIDTVIPALKRGEGITFPSFDAFNRIAYDYARSGVARDRLLDEFKQTRHALVERLLAEPDVVVKHVTVNGVETCPHTGTPYSLLYIIHEFNDHDRHHQNQILAVI